MLTDKKITSQEISANNVKSVPGTKLTGTVTQNKNVFDKLVELVSTKHNGIIDELINTATGTSGADNIGSPVLPGGSATTVKGQIAELKISLDGKVNVADSKNYTQEEKDKLAGIENNANNYSLPTASTTVLGGVKVDGISVVVANGVLSSQSAPSPDLTARAAIAQEVIDRQNADAAESAARTNADNSLAQQISSVSARVTVLEQNQPYTQNMVKFFAIPSSTGKVRLKIEKPLDATGVMIRYKTTAWAYGDTKESGTLVANITDDTNYKGSNQWYEVSGLTNGTVYYFKAFLYKDSVYNQTIGLNETGCKAGGLQAEYTMDSISGSTVNDTSGNSYNGTNTGVTFSTGLVGNKGNFTNTSMITFANFANPSANEVTIAGIFSFAQIATSCYGVVLDSANGSPFYVGSKNGKLAVFNPSGEFVSTLPITASASYFVICKSNRATGECILKIRLIGDLSWSVNSGSLPIRGASSGTNTLGDIAAGKFSGTLDQIRIFNRYTSDYEDDSLFNGGLGC